MSIDCLVVGGCGFLGYHLVANLLRDPDIQRIYILDRNISLNTHKGPTYLQGNITNQVDLALLISKLRPTVIFHAASPIAALPTHRQPEFAATNIHGTAHLLSIAKATPSVKALVYTSSADVYTDPPHEDVVETHALWPETDYSNEYNRTKAIADGLVRAANGGKLRTACLRLVHAYGDRQLQGMVEMLDACKGSGPLFQVGDGKNLMEVVSGENVAIAHVLTAKALLRESEVEGAGEVSGQAFNISDGQPVPFWHHTRVIWKTARGQDELKNLWRVPAWVMVAIVICLEWVLWLGTRDRFKPPISLSRASMEYCVYNHTYKIDKARKLLGFEPVANHDEVLAEATRRAVAGRNAENVDQYEKEKQL